VENRVVKLCFEDVNCIDLGQVPVAVSCEHFSEPSGTIKCGEFLFLPYYLNLTIVC
jgi:hypothetical protein